ncbi:hypothetical protein K0M31_001702 [Melipona bicolor]|uniref:Uncharacterized protein n=1 Tax=Melipona bicolor TaxID=60889 RepID=A0AA40KY31_9HYME|nr:hypothetical protein K0M31_001702 [Melipona bicolor]
MATLADRVMEPRLPQISNLEGSNMATSGSHSKESNNDESKMAAMQHQLAEVTHQLAAMRTKLEGSNMATSASHPKADNDESKMTAIQHQLAEMTHELAAIKTDFSRRRPFDRQPRFNDRRSRSRGRLLQAQQHTTTGYCYYHFNFGGHARNCKKPCSWSSNTVPVTQPSGN